MMKRRVIDQLREEYPGPWRYDTQLMRWEGPHFNVEARSHLAPKYEGDDESCVTRYHRTDTQEEVLVGFSPFSKWIYAGPPEDRR